MIYSEGDVIQPI